MSRNLFIIIIFRQIFLCSPGWLELLVLLSLDPKNWDYRHVVSQAAHV